MRWQQLHAASVWFRRELVLFAWAFLSFGGLLFALAFALGFFAVMWGLPR